MLGRKVFLPGREEMSWPLGWSPGVEDGRPGPQFPVSSRLGHIIILLLICKMGTVSLSLDLSLPFCRMRGMGNLVGPKSLLGHLDQPVRVTLLESKSTISSLGKP